MPGRPVTGEVDGLGSFGADERPVVGGVLDG